MSNRIAFRSRATAAALFSVLLLVACGDDGPTGPSEDFELAGTWQWRITNATSGVISCTVDNVTLSFTGANTAPSGQVAGGGGGNIKCTTNGNPGSNANFTVTEDLDNLSFNGSAISFSFPTSTGTWEMSGTVTSDNAMGGTGTIRLVGSGQSLALTGPWTATRN